MKILLTGIAGFIGFHTARRLAEEGHQILGVDNINDYYDVRHKHARLEILKSYKNIEFEKLDICNLELLRRTWRKFSPDHVLHLAAQAGVRYSLENPMAYVQANIIGFQHIIDLIREMPVRNFVYASSSSVYGSNKESPFSETQDVSHPISLYAASKKANELFASCYNHLFSIPSVGLRFFTVYGPNARPDMALFKFAALMQSGQKISVYNYGKMTRDFTYIDDIVGGIIASLESAKDSARVYNLGRGQPQSLMRMIELLEENLGIRAEKEFLPLQAGDVPETVADVSLAAKEIGYSPKVSLDEGVRMFSKWFKDYKIS